MNKKIFILFIFCLLLTNILNAEDAVDVKQLFNYAQGLFLNNETTLAKESFYKIIYLYPESEFKKDALFMIAKCYEKEGNFWYAKWTYEKFIKEYPADKNVEEAKKYLELCNINIQDSEKPLLTAEERTADKYINFGYTFMVRSVRTGEFGIVYNQEELEAAFYWYNKVIKEFPNSERAAKAQYFLGDAYMQQARQADYEKAVVEYQKVIDNYPDTYWAKRAGIQIGDVYQNSIRDKKKAIEAYKKVVEMLKDNPNSYFVSYAKAQINYLSK